MKTKLSYEGSIPGVLPWLDSALETGKAVCGQYYEIRKVQESRKRSGYTVSTEDFMVYLWKSDPITDVLLETLNYLIRQNPGSALFICPNEDSVEGFDLCTDDQISRMWTNSKKQRVLEVFTCANVQNTQPSARLKKNL